MIGIYKITNLINGHSYIGQSVDIYTRWNQHRSPYEWSRQPNKILYKAFIKYGLDNFKFEILEECSPQELNDKEKYWIKYYNTYYDGYNQLPGGDSQRGENQSHHKLTEQDIKDIRTRYNNKERKKVVYQDYKDRIGESGFHKIWNYESWQGIMPEVYTSENKEYHLHDTSQRGSENGRAKLTEQDVYNIRTRKKQGEKLASVYQDYNSLLTFGSFKQVWYYQNWVNIIV